MEQINYVSVDRIFSKLQRDLGLEGVNEVDVVEWTGEALEAIGAISLYEEAVAFIEVKNHQCNLPRNLHNIIQIARNTKWTGYRDKDNCLCPNKIIEDVNCDCEDKKCVPDYVILDCNGMPLVDYDLAYYRPYFDLQYEYYGWCNSSCRKRDYVPVRLSNHSFFNSIVCDESKNSCLYTHCTDEYNIVGGNVLRFSFKNGFIALAYTRQMLSPETGYPMIPDHYSYVTAITKYVTMKLSERDFYAGREGSNMRLQKAEADWQWYCKQAGNQAMIPKGIDAYENIMKTRSRFITNTENYFGYFGKM